MRKIAN